MKIRGFLITVILLITLTAGHPPQVAFADAGCFLDGVGGPTPEPIGITRIVIPKCPNYVLQVNSVGPNGSPLPIQSPFSGVVTQGTSPWIVNTPAPFSGIVTQGTSPWVVNTPPPFSGIISGTVTANAGAGFPTPLAIQPVSGTVTVNTPAPYPTAAVGSYILVAPTALPTVSVTVVNTPTVNQGTSPWVVTTPAPFNGVVSGTVTANAGTGTMTVGQATGTNLHAVLDSGTTTVTQATAANLNTTAAQGGTWTVQPGNTPNSSPWLTTISQGGFSALVLSGGSLKTASYVDGGGTPTQALACGSSVAVNISTATTTSLVAVSGATSIYVCSYSLYMVSGTLPSFKFEYGTGAACVTTQTLLTGTYGGIAGAIGELFNSGTGLGTVFRTPASQALCLVSAGTTPNIQGVITYSQF